MLEWNTKSSFVKSLSEETVCTIIPICMGFSPFNECSTFAHPLNVAIWDSYKRFPP